MKRTRRKAAQKDRQRLKASHFAALLPRLLAQLGSADGGRVKQLPDLFEGDRLPLGRVLDALYPDKERDEQLKAFTNLRIAVNRACAEAGLDLHFAADTRKRTPPEGRLCWFEGESQAGPLVTHVSAAGASGTDPASSIHEQRGRIVYPTAVPGADQRRPVRYVAVHAPGDAGEARKLLDALRPHLAISPAHSYSGWTPADIRAGQRPADVRAAAEGACDLLLVLVSPQLLADAEARRSWDAARRAGKLVVPVLLRRVDPRRQDVSLLDGAWPFPDFERQFAGRSPEGREAFALGLYQTLEARVQELDALPEGRPAGNHAERIFSRHLMLDGELPAHPVEARGRYTALGHKGEPGDEEAEAPAATPSAAHDDVQAVDYIVKWASGPGEAPLFALLGEYGIGKTTTCRLVTQRLIDARRNDPRVPLPIYLDLRHYTWNKDREIDFHLADILERVLAKSYRAGTGPRPSAQDVFDLVQQQGAVVLFDGLDEVIVHMSPKLGRDFIRALWSLRGPAADEQAEKRAGKLLISCRSHYFRRVWEQNSMLRGEEREGLRRDDYRALVLLPFDLGQIEEYLARNVPGLDVERALELIRSVHNLSELAERPFTLSLLGEFLPDLERRAQAGREIQGVDLYDAMVTRWLLRDEGKHQFNPTHKEVLMERLAAALWGSGRREWSCEELENWLDDTLHADARLLGVYAARDREVLKEDLRTATFLVRPGDESFRFAHTSLQEYFLARHLHRALREGAAERLELPLPSRETLEFLLQLLKARPRAPQLGASAQQGASTQQGAGTQQGASTQRGAGTQQGAGTQRGAGTQQGASERAAAERAACERTLGEVLGRYRPQGSELALALWLHAQARGEALARPARLDLRGARLGEWRFEAPPGRRLDLRHADLRAADLKQAVFVRVELSHAELSGACARLAEFHEVELSHGRCDADHEPKADLIGSIWRRCTLATTDLRGATLDKSQFIRCQLEKTTWPEGEPPTFAATIEDGNERTSLVPPSRPAGGEGWGEGAADDENAQAAAARLRLDTFTGHSAGVWACAWSPDGRHVVSGSADKTLRVWDATTGASVRTLAGHGGRVLACAWSPDGRHVVSGSYDKTLRVWDATTGASVRTLAGHGGWVRACAWSPDGRQVLSGSADGSTRVWDAATGRLLLTIARFADGSEAVFDEAPRRLRRATAGAWRWLGFLAPDPRTGELRRYPAESFGPLPGAE